MPAAKKPTAHPNAAAAIAAAQGQMSNAVKDASNPHFGKTFASLAAVRDVVLPAFAAEGVAVLQPIEGEPGQVTVRTLLFWGDQVIECGNCTVPISSGGRNYCQDVGAVATYQRRYQLAAAGGISQEDNDAEGLAPPPPQKRRQEAPQRVPDGQGYNEAPAQSKRATAPSRGRGGGISWARSPCPKCGAKVYDNRGDDGPTLFKCSDGPNCPARADKFGWAEFDDPGWDDKEQARLSADANDAAGSSSANADPMANQDQPPPHDDDQIPF